MFEHKGECDAFEHLCSSLAISHNAMVAMLTAYFDESGTDRTRSSTLAVAGYVSTKHNWARFAKHWQKLLDDEGLDYFHRADIETLKGQFSAANGWNEKRKIAVLKRAHRIINKWKIQSFGQSLFYNDYDSVVANSTREEPIKPYFILANACLLQVSQWARTQGYREAIHYVFERGADGSGDVINAAYSTPKRKPEVAEGLMIASITVAPKKDEWRKGVFYPGVIQLQAADVYVYEGWKQVENRIAQGPIRDVRKSLEDLRTPSDTGFYFNRQSLAEYYAYFEKNDDAWNKTA